MIKLFFLTFFFGAQQQEYATYRDIQRLQYDSLGGSINAVTVIPGHQDTLFIAVGDSGMVYLLDVDDEYIPGIGYIKSGKILTSYRIDASYNLTGVSFPTSDTGYIVGYKNTLDDYGRPDLVGEGLKGAYWKTTDGPLNPGNWREPKDIDFGPDKPPVNIPYLDVCFVNDTCGWVSAGLGYLCYTEDGGKNWEVYNPGEIMPSSIREYYQSPADWWWRIDVNPDNPTEVWAGGDGTGLFVHGKMVNGEMNWNYWFLGKDIQLKDKAEGKLVLDTSLVYNDTKYIPGGPLTIACSKGKIIYRNNSTWWVWKPVRCLTWEKEEADTCQWINGVSLDKISNTNIQI